MNDSFLFIYYRNFIQFCTVLDLHYHLLHYYRITFIYFVLDLHNQRRHVYQLLTKQNDFINWFKVHVCTIVQYNLLLYYFIVEIKLHKYIDDSTTKWSKNKIKVNIWKNAIRLTWSSKPKLANCTTRKAKVYTSV